jgi:hypothetical protein
MRLDNLRRRFRDELRASCLKVIACLLTILGPTAWKDLFDLASANQKSTPPETDSPTAEGDLPTAHLITLDSPVADIHAQIDENIADLARWESEGGAVG